MTILKTIIGTLLVCLMACSSSGGSSLSFGPDANGISFTAPSGFSDFSNFNEDETNVFQWMVGSITELTEKFESGNILEIPSITFNKATSEDSLDNVKAVSVCGVTGKQGLNVIKSTFVYFTVNDQLYKLEIRNVSDEDIEALLKSCTGK